MYAFENNHFSQFLPLNNRAYLVKIGEKNTKCSTSRRGFPPAWQNISQLITRYLSKQLSRNQFNLTKYRNSQGHELKSPFKYGTADQNFSWLKLSYLKLVKRSYSSFTASVEHNDHTFSAPKIPQFNASITSTPKTPQFNTFLGSTPETPQFRSVLRGFWCWTEALLVLKWGVYGVELICWTEGDVKLRETF